MQGHEHYWNLTMYDICVLVHKLSQKKQLQKPSHVVFSVLTLAWHFARRVLTEIKLIFFFDWRFKWRMSGYVNRGWKVQMKHALKLTAS